MTALRNSANESAGATRGHWGTANAAWSRQPTEAQTQLDRSQLDRSQPLAFPCHEFGQVLEGEVSITTTDGKRQTFVAGDVFFIAKGTVTTWEVPTHLRKYYATVHVPG